MPFTEFKKCEKYPWRSDTFSKVILKVTVKVTLFHGCFSRFFKLYKCYQIAQRITCAQSIYVCWWVSQITVFIPFALTFMWVKIVSIYENCVGAKPRFYYFAGCFLYLCKLMLLHLKSLWHYSQDTTKAISAIIDGTTTKTSFIAQYVDEREIFHIFFKENANKWVLHTRKKMCAKMSSKLYCSKFYNKNVPYFNIKLTCFT